MSTFQRERKEGKHKNENKIREKVMCHLVQLIMFLLQHIFIYSTCALLIYLLLPFQFLFLCSCCSSCETAFFKKFLYSFIFSKWLMDEIGFAGNTMFCAFDGCCKRFFVLNIFFKLDSEWCQKSLETLWIFFASGRRVVESFSN